MIRQGDNHINMRSEMNVTETCAFIYVKTTTKTIDLRKAILYEKQTVVVCISKDTHRDSNFEN